MCDLSIFGSGKYSDGNDVCDFSIHFRERNDVCDLSILGREVESIVMEMMCAICASLELLFISSYMFRCITFC